MSVFDELKSDLEAAFDGDEAKAIAVESGVLLGRLSAMRLIGKDVDAEIRHVHATALELTAAAKARLEGVVMTWVGRLVSGVVSAALV